MTLSAFNYHNPVELQFGTGSLARLPAIVQSLGGPFADGSGGLIIYEVATKEDAEALRDQDPFAIGGVFVRSEIKPWLLLAINPALVTQD